MNNDYMNSFKEILRLKYGSCSSQSYSDWIQENTFLKAKRYSYIDHEYQIAPIDDPARILVLEKCAQLGFTECFFRWMLAFLVRNQGSQSIFTQPTDKDIGTFVKSRADLILEECPIVKRLGTGGVDSVQLKRIGASFFNFRGTFGARAAISVPSDANNYDEVNFSNPRVLNQYKSRLQHSAFKLERYISTPTIPNYGVSEFYNRSDKKRLWLKCNRCGEWQLLDWPGNIFFRRHNDGVVIPYNEETMELYVEKEFEYHSFIGCIKCQREVNRAWEYREWVAEFPERNRDPDSGISGYHINQLDATYIKAVEIVRASDKRLDGYKRIEDFYNSCLAMPYEGGDGVKITEESKLVADIKLAMANEASGTFMGIDLGNICNVSIIKDLYLPEYNRPIPVKIAAYRINKEVLEEKIPELITRYGCLYIVSDAQPYTVTMERMSKNYPGRMSICYFGGKGSFTLSGDAVQVTANRTIALDEVTSGISTGFVKIATGIPDYDIIWKHLKNLVKVRAEDDDGSEYYEYVKVGDDHYGYSLAYALLARKVFIEERPAGMHSCAPVNIVGSAVPI